MVDYSGNKTGNNTEFIRRVVSRMFSEINVCIPAQIEAFDPATQMVECVPMIRRRVKNPDGSEEIVDCEKLIKVPLLTPYVRILGFSLTMPVSPGDICLLLFADKPLDLWQETGDVSDPPETKGSRNHHITDGIAILSPIPLPNAIEDYQIDSAEIRNDDRTTALQVWEEKAEVRAKPGNYTTWNDDGDVNTYAPSSIDDTALIDIVQTAGVNNQTYAGLLIEEETLGDISNFAGGIASYYAEGALNITSLVSVNITAPLITLNGAVIASSSVEIGGVDHDGHTHTSNGPGVETSTENNI